MRLRRREEAEEEDDASKKTRRGGAERTLLVWTRNKTRNTIVTYAFRLRAHHVHSSINSLMPGGHIS